MKVKKSIITMILSTSAAFMLSTVASFAATSAQTTANLNIRKGPSTSYSIVTTAKKGSTLQILEKMGDWTKVQYGSKVGYSSNKYLKEIGNTSSNQSSNSTSNSTQSKKMAVTASNLNVRQGASTSSKVIGKLSKGSTVDTFEIKNGWAKIKFNNQTAYVSSQYLKSINSSSNPGSNNNKPIQSKKMEVTASNLNVRQGASTSSKVIGKLSKGSTVDTFEIKNGWAKIKFNNQTAYVSSQYLKNINSSSNPGSNNNNSIQSKKMEVTASNLNVRQEASTSSKVIGKLSKGSTVDTFEIKNGWAKIKFNNQTAYVSSQYLKNINNSTAQSQESFVANLNVSKQTNQIVTVVGKGGYNVNVILHEKDSNGKWKESLSTSGTVGSKGIGIAKEGSKTTPSGVFGFTFAFGNASNPGTAFEYRKVNNNHYWVDDPKSIHYNRWVDVTKVKKDWNSAEHLSSFKNQYKYSLALDYNYHNVIPGNGSAFFLHVGTGSPTAGCIAVPESKMVSILNKVKPGSKIVIAKNMNDIKKY
ncbi:SH3 domain-containing protein [Paraclostridium bifermentans]|uniref:SH3 domain-containing protein n=1 Tax=Paraclostridium bifermentans TaxID=1490 RepID=UPI001FF4311D|nr:SH3 domain-containing protein [Paraclostridium bifermentans]UOW67280.1 SH3 domain-containing protein [Paraclostridium bifermentans]